MNTPELLSPAGNWDCAKAAIENGADAIYFGLERFNARMRAENFTESDLPELMEFLHWRGVKGYVTLNTLIFQNELVEAEQYLRSIIAAGVDAVIVQDIGICRLIRHLSPDFPIHGSTQMTVTSAAGVEFAKELGCQLVVLARECSIKEINKIQKQLTESNLTLPLEVFVHGALCVAYSGQCLTSEALGGRSANRGECAQACRMPYELISDGEAVNLGDRRYLLSPQDLSGLAVLPDLVKSGVTCLKIEGRLKSPEYVANVTRVYRNALDQAITDVNAERYNLEMAFSRGLHTGWFEGINNQELVHARFGKKRGVYLGEVTQIQHEQITIATKAPVKPGDGVVFDSGHPEAKEEGGRIYAVEQHRNQTVLTFGRDQLNLRRIDIGDRVWKTSDPELDRQIRQTYAGDQPKFQRPIDIEIHGEIGKELIAIARDTVGHITRIESEMPLIEAHSKPLTTERLKEQFGRLGNTPFCLGKFENHLTDAAMIPVSELNRMRREIVDRLENLRMQPKQWQLDEARSHSELLPRIDNESEKSPEFSIPADFEPKTSDSKSPTRGGFRGQNPLQPQPELTILVRNLQQLETVLKLGIQTIYCEFEDPRAYRQAVELTRQRSDAEIWAAPPRITKPSEQWILEQVRKSNADGYLIRNYDHLKFFEHDRKIGDFSLNIANAITANYFKQFGLEHLTASYDLNIQQLIALLKSCPPNWLEITIHQHMPMFHMEHCVFCAFLSTGTDFTNCGRPCEQHEVKLRLASGISSAKHPGIEHILQADAGCRNTVFNGTAQTGAEFLHHLVHSGAQRFRVEFLNESSQQITQTIALYRQLLNHEITGAQLWRDLKLQNQLGVTRGTLT
ncbi:MULTISPECIES: U32 family peptidase [Leptolyngbya]|uniref:U32 family peptidase n=1 Tax=Leptolyngbya TaxID=47251 RepID=UPI001689FC19|nr:U32 family peptidase [Leptolyngbya sp. FACHB-1624]MBD1854472.1 U32 family peptidase [Leptolyngbya sp. FACHB-1624]